MSDNRTLTGLKRGFMQHCPHCGEGKLFRKYLKVQQLCEACGHDNGQYPADDAPPYFTILIVGHVIIAPVLAFPYFMQGSPWVALLVSLPLLAVFTLWLLPRVKGAVVGLQWSIRENYKALHGHYPAPPRS